MTPRFIMLNVFATILSIGGGALIGIIDLHTSEVVITLAMVFVLSMVLGAIAPRGGWYWAVLSVLGVPLVNLFPRIAGVLQILTFPVHSVRISS